MMDENGRQGRPVAEVANTDIHLCGRGRRGLALLVQRGSGLIRRNLIRGAGRATAETRERQRAECEQGRPLRDPPKIRAIRIRDSPESA